MKSKALELHKLNKGKIEVISKVPLSTSEDLSLAYSPGVAEPCLEIVRNPETIYDYTAKGNMVAIITDGSAVLGLGNIGPYAALPVMEGKAILFKEFGNVDAYPICLDTQDTEEIIKTIKLIAPGFGGINLEDISAPRCVEIEMRLKKELDIPVFHDDQHGTAVVCLAALINSLKVIGKDKTKIRLVVSGIGAAGSAIIRTLHTYGVKTIIAVDIDGILNLEQSKDYNFVKKEMLNYITYEQGDLTDALKDADVFIGVSAANIVTKTMVSSMKKDSIVLAMANPTPEIMPYLALEAGARIVGTGRSDFPNQVNNVSAFPGIFRGAFDAKATTITTEMMVEAASAIASFIPDDQLNEQNIIPSALNKDVANIVAERVRLKAIDQKITRKEKNTLL